MNTNDIIEDDFTVGNTNSVFFFSLDEDASGFVIMYFCLFDNQVCISWQNTYTLRCKFNKREFTNGEMVFIAFDFTFIKNSFWTFINDKRRQNVDVGFDNEASRVNNNFRGLFTLMRAYNLPSKVSLHLAKWLHLYWHQFQICWRALGRDLWYQGWFPRWIWKDSWDRRFWLLPFFRIFH